MNPMTVAFFKNRRFVILIAPIFLLAALLVFHENVLLALGGFLVIEDKLLPADIIHVIAGEDYRSDYAIQLFQRGLAKQMFFTGGWCKIHMRYHGSHAKMIAAKKGIPINLLAVDDTEVTSTYAEVVRLKEFILRSEKPLKSVIVVSDPYHMWRSRWTYKEVLGDEVKVRMAPVPFEFSPFKKIWWRHAESRKFVKDEFLKILYYYARYKFSSGSY